MQPILRSDAPLPVRLVFVAFGLFATVVAAFIIPPAIHSTALRLLVTYALVVFGFLAVPSVATSRFSRLPLQITTISVIVAASYVLWLIARTLSAPLVAGQETSLIITIGLAGLALAAQRALPRLAFWALMILAIKAVATIASAVVTGPPTELPAAAQYALVLNAIWIGGSLAAAWHGRHVAPAASNSVAHAA